MTTINSEVLAGLQLPQKTISPKYFYDERGSLLFEEICRVPEYYVTRTEQKIIEANLGTITNILGDRAELLEFASGASLKTRMLLSAIHGQGTYVPIDISPEILAREADRLQREYPALRVVPLCADFTELGELPEHLEQELSDDTSNRVLFFPGSTIGNFEPRLAYELLDRIGKLIGDDGHLIIGVDLMKDPKVLEAAYNDSSQVTAAFNLNLLARLNRECGANFNLDHFEHRAIFNPNRSRIEMHIRSSRDQAVKIGGEVIPFRHGETIHTESSYKYDQATFISLLRHAGFSRVETWTDPDGLFSVYHAA